MVTVKPSTPLNTIHGFTYSDAAGIKRCHSALFSKQEEAEAVVASVISSKPPGFMTEVSFFHLEF
jgi:hypothetical protein